MTTAGQRIERFLSDYPEGRLLVAVGYASPYGLAWLSERTAGRPVQLLIGDARDRYYTRAYPESISASLAFLARADVEVRNWYRTNKSRQGAAKAHLKAWAVEHHGWPVAALAGSANLTYAGATANVEAMVEATGLEADAVHTQLTELMAKSWDCAGRLHGLISRISQAA